MKMKANMIWCPKKSCWKLFRTMNGEYKYPCDNCDKKYCTDKCEMLVQIYVKEIEDENN